MAETLSPAARERRRGLLFTVLAALCAACTVGPDYVPPDPALPDAWRQELTRGLAEGEADLQTWWLTLDDPALDRLIARAVENNLDLRTAVARIDEALALRGIERGQFFPVIDGAGGYARERLSEETLAAPPPPQSRTEDFFIGGFDATWEIDVFGRIRRSVESAQADLEASIEDYRDLLVTLLAQVASTYFEVCTLQQRLRFATANAAAQRDTLQLTRDRAAAEIAPELDVRQAELNLARTESIIPSLRSLLAQATNRLGVLLGERPDFLHEELAEERELPAPPDEILVGLPANLLRQRPDIRGAERRLAAQTALIGVATADLYPRFSLSGTFALEALEFSDMWGSAARTWSFGPSFRWNLFDGGRIRNSVRAADARAQQALLQYEQTVLLALEEVESAMVSYVEEFARRDLLAASAAAAQRSVELVRILYTTGLTDFQNVLDMERSLFVQQDELAVSEGELVKNLVRVYTSLGGGWAPAEQTGAGDGADESARME